MSLIQQIEPQAATSKVYEIYQKAQQMMGYVLNRTNGTASISW